MWWCTFFLPCTTVFPKVIAWWCFHVCSSGMQNHYYSDIHTQPLSFFSLQSEHFSVWMRQSLWGKVAAAPTMSSVWKSKEKGRCLENDNQEEKEIVWNGFFSLSYCTRTWLWIVDDNLTFQAVLLLLRLRKTSIHKYKEEVVTQAWRFYNFFASQELIHTALPSLCQI